MIEQLLEHAWPQEKPKLNPPFPRISYSQAMDEVSHAYKYTPRILREHIALKYIINLLYGITPLPC